MSPTGHRAHGDPTGVTPKCCRGSRVNLALPERRCAKHWVGLGGTGGNWEGEGKTKPRSRRRQGALWETSLEISTYHGNKILLFPTGMPAAQHPPPATEAGCSLVILHHLFSLADRKKCRQKSDVSYAGWHRKCCFNCILFGNKKREARTNPRDIPSLPPFKISIW